MGNVIYLRKERRCNLEEPFPFGPLNMWSWKDISRASRGGKAKKYFNIGDTKDILIGNKQYQVRIIGFDHDIVHSRDSYGRTEAGITFEMISVLDAKITLNTSFDLVQYYGHIYMPSLSDAQSTMSSYINSMTDLNGNSISDYMVSVIKPVYGARTLPSFNDLWGNEDNIYKIYNEHDFNQANKNLGFILSATEYGYNESLKYRTTDGYYTYKYGKGLIPDIPDATTDRIYSYYSGKMADDRKKTLNGEQVSYLTRTYSGLHIGSSEGTMIDGSPITTYSYNDDLISINRNGVFTNASGSVPVYFSLGFCV